MPPGVNAAQFRIAIAEALAYNVKAYDLATVCEALGLAAAKEGENPYDSKRMYVSSRLLLKPLAELVELARRIDEEYDDADVRALLGRLSSGVDGELKNLIFAADGPKPRIVLRDAINNVIEIVENAEHCLVYDRPLSPQGLRWADLIDWWMQTRGSAEHDRDTSAKQLYVRLNASLTSPPERILFRAYGRRYADTTGDVPALIPQVYLHYDPYTRTELAAGSGQTLVRQRMDFLLLLPDRARVVIEVDGRQHYANDQGVAVTSKYAEMVREDRRLRLAGYEVYRFGGHELSDDHGERVAGEFFAALLDRHAPN